MSDTVFKEDKPVGTAITGIVYDEIDEKYDTDILTELAEQQLEIQDEIDQLNAQLTEKQDRLKKISKEQLPKAMTFLKMGSYTLLSGKGVSIKKNYYASIKDNEEQAIDYLKTHELDDIVKNIVTSEFSRGEEKRASELFENLLKMGYSVSNKKSIHASTLKAFVKERIEGREDLEDAYRTTDRVPCEEGSDGRDEYVVFAENRGQLHDLQFPSDIFKVFVVEEAVIKEPKRKRKKK